MAWNIVVGVYVLWVGLTRVKAQEGSPCVTPNRFPGECVSLYACDSLNNLLRTYPRDARVIPFLQASNCGFLGSQPLVCCARSQSIPTQPPPSSTTTTEVVTTRTTPTTQRVEASTPGGTTGVHELPRWPYCGLRNDSMKTDRIVGGRPAALGEFPWILALGYRNEKNANNPKWLCGGSLITDKHALTAGHCIRPDLYLVRAGDLDLYSDDDGAQPVNIPIARALRHEEYNAQLHTNDIAVLVLSRPAKGYLIAPICLPVDEPLRSKTFDSYTPLVAGWGSIYFQGPTAPHLQVVQLPIVPLSTCSISYSGIRGATIDQRVLCAGGSKDRDSCGGDSGGPLVLSYRQGDNFHMHQLGVVSYGRKCAEPGFPGVYTRLTEFIPWIQRNLL